MKRLIVILTALLVLLTGVLPLWATAEEMSADDWWESLVPDSAFDTNQSPEQEQQFEKDLQDVLKDILKVEPATGEEDGSKDDAGFLDEDIRRVTSQAYGGKTEYAKIGDWTVSRGYLDDRYCLIGQKDGSSQRVALSTNDPVSFVPAGDSVIYYAEYAKGKFDWVIHNPDDDGPIRLALDADDDAFFADEQYIWYVTQKGGETRICRFSRLDEKKETMGSTPSHVYTMLKNGAVLVYDFDEETVQLFRDGRFTTVYQGAFQAIATSGGGIWLERDGEYGLLVDGELNYMLPGHIMGGAGTSDQQVLLIAPYLDSDTLDVMMFNDVYQAYAYVGAVRSSNNSNVEIAADSITVWGAQESLIFDIPEVSYWYPYGQTEPKATDDEPPLSR